MTTDDPTRHFDHFETDRIGTDCRGCGRTIVATVPEVDAHGDCWVRCGDEDCRTINRVKGVNVGPDDGEAEA